MSGSQLPLFGRGRTKYGRHRRTLDALARDIRKNGRSAFVDAMIDAARIHAEAADALEADDEASLHTLNLVGSHYRQALHDLHPYVSDDLSGRDPLADALAAALSGSGS